MHKNLRECTATIHSLAYLFTQSHVTTTDGTDLSNSFSNTTALDDEDERAIDVYSQLEDLAHNIIDTCF